MTHGRAILAAAVVAALLSGCAGGPAEGADDSVALVRGTQTKDLTSLDNCLEKAGFSASPDEVEESTLSTGDTAHLVRFTSGGDDIRFTVIPDRQFVYVHADADAAVLDRIGCAIEGRPLTGGSKG